MKIWNFSTLPPFLLGHLLPHKLLALWSTYSFFNKIRVKERSHSVVPFQSLSKSIYSSFKLL